jgi:hypothetical protein
MILNVITNEEQRQIDVPQDILADAHDFFVKMDRDMDKGWQMSRTWVDHPDQVDRCRIAANKLLTALETNNQYLMLLMAGYILTRMPGINGVDIDTSGDMTATELIMGPTPAPLPISDRPTRAPQKIPVKTKVEAMEQAGEDVTKVYKVGRAYRFARYDHDQGEWLESPLIKDKQEANKLRMAAWEQRVQELLQDIEP